MSKMRRGGGMRFSIGRIMNSEFNFDDSEFEDMNIFDIFDEIKDCFWAQYPFEKKKVEEK